LADFGTPKLRGKMLPDSGLKQALITRPIELVQQLEVSQTAVRTEEQKAQKNPAVKGENACRSLVLDHIGEVARRLIRRDATLHGEHQTGIARNWLPNLPSLGH